MAIANRALDPTQQKYVLPVNIMALGTSQIVVTGTTVMGGIVPEPSTFIGAQMAAFGVSGSPTFEIAVNRFIAGTGFTTWLLAKGTSNIPAAVGTSGVGAFGTSLFGASAMITIGSGSTLSTLLANDVLTVTVAGSNAAVTGAHVGIILQPIQDLKYRYNVGL